MNTSHQPGGGTAVTRLVEAAAQGERVSFETALTALRATGGAPAVYGQLHTLAVMLLRRLPEGPAVRARERPWARAGHLPGDNVLPARIARFEALLTAGAPLETWHPPGQQVNVAADALALCALVVGLARELVGDVPVTEELLVELSTPLRD